MWNSVFFLYFKGELCLLQTSLEIFVIPSNFKGSLKFTLVIEKKNTTKHNCISQIDTFQESTDPTMHLSCLTASSSMNFLHILNHVLFKEARTNTQINHWRFNSLINSYINEVNERKVLRVQHFWNDLKVLSICMWKTSNTLQANFVGMSYAQPKF